MAYRWSLEGPAFEFPTPYRAENRFLLLRGYALITVALLIVALVALLEGGTRIGSVAWPVYERASAVPHLVGAMWLGVLGALDLLQAAARRTLLLAPGQPASLASELAREASGAGEGSAALRQWLEMGAVQAEACAHAPVSEPAQADGRARDGDTGQAAPVPATAPTSLQRYMAQRRMQLKLCAGLASLLALALAGLRSPPALALAASVPLLAGLALLARHLLLPHRPALARKQGLALLGCSLLAAAVLAAFAERLPRAADFVRLGLPLAAVLLLAGMALVEWLALRSARAQLQMPWLAAVPATEAVVSFEADPDELLREVNLELHRHWAEGVPNRRYVWQLPQLAAGEQEGVYAAMVLEESQPLVSHAAHGSASALSPERQRPLLALDRLGLAFSLAGALSWLWLAWAHMRDAGASWLPAASGLACLALGTYAVRLGHLPWSRIEVVSTLTWLDFNGRYKRQAAAARTRSAPSVRVDDLQLRARVAQARSVFYAAAPHGLGSRVLLEVASHPGGAGAWQQMMQRFATSSLAQVQARPAVARARATRHGADVAAPAAAAPARARHTCPHCGTAVQAGARFCHHCGAVLGAA